MGILDEALGSDKKNSILDEALTDTQPFAPTQQAQPTQEQGFIPDVKNAWNEFTTNINTPPPSDIRNISPIAGGFFNSAVQTANLGLNVGMAGLRGAYRNIPEPIKQGMSALSPINPEYVKRGMQEVMPYAQQGMEAYRKYIPESTRNDIGGVLTLASMIPARAATLPMAKGLSKGVKETGAIVNDSTALFNRVLEPVTESAVDKNIKQVVTDNINKSIKASSKGKDTLPMIQQYFKDADVGIREIVNNKQNLQLTNDVGDVIKGELPQNRMQMAEAIQNTKSKLFQEYDSMQQAAGKRGATLDLEPVAKQLDDVINNESLRADKSGRAIIKYAEEQQQILREVNKMTPQAAQDWIKNANGKLLNKNLVPEEASKAAVDAGTASIMRNKLDELIETNVGAGYQDLKKRYGAVKSLEKGTDKAAFASFSERGLPNFFDITSGTALVHGILSMNPATVAGGTFMETLNALRRKYSNPDTYIKKMFNDVDNMTKSKTAFEPQSMTGKFIKGQLPQKQNVSQTITELPEAQVVGQTLWEPSKQPFNMQNQRILDMGDEVKLLPQSTGEPYTMGQTNFNLVDKPGLDMGNPFGYNPKKYGQGLRQVKQRTRKDILGGTE
jgi:hypothetical protein